MSERPTPETDAMCICTHYKSFKAIGGVVNPDFARRLERERDDLKDQLTAAMMSIRLQQRREQQTNEQP